MGFFSSLRCFHSAFLQKVWDKPNLGQGGDFNLFELAKFDLLGEKFRLNRQSFLFLFDVNERGSIQINSSYKQIRQY